MVRELYIDDQRVDLPDDVRFQLTFQIADFGDLSPRGSGSNTIKLPKTPRNVGIFERCNFVQVASNFPYALHSAYYYEDGFLVFNDATVYMLAITEKDFEIQCVWGNATEIRRLKALDMGNVAGLGNVNYGADMYGWIETGQKGVQGVTMPFPLATKNGLVSAYTRGLLSINKALEAAGFQADMSAAVRDYLSDLYAFPAVTKGRIRYDNVVFNGAIHQDLNDGDYNNYTNLQPYDGNKATLSSNPVDRRKAMIPVTINDYTVPTQGGTPFDGINVPFTLKGGWYDVNMEVSGIMFQYPGGLPPYGADDFILSAVCVLSQSIAGNDTALYERESESSLIINIDRDWWREGKKYTASKRIYISDEAVDMGDGVKAVPELYCAVWPTETGRPQSSLYNEAIQAKIKLTMTQLPVESEIEINMPDETKSGTKHYVTVPMNGLLKGVSAYDFVTQSLVNSGAIFDHANGATRVYTYNDIVNNASEMLDWSDKLVYIKEENTFNQSQGGNNWVKYKATDDYNGYGDGSFNDPLAQRLGKEDKTLIENSVFTFNNGVYDQRDVLFIPFVTEKTEKDGTKSYEFKDRGFNLVRMSATVSGNLVNEEHRMVSPYTRVNGPASSQPTFSNIRGSNWSSYIAMQQAYRKAKAIFMLSPRDVAELDFKKPVYLRQYAQAYIVTKVNYQPHASTVEMMLIR